MKFCNQNRKGLLFIRAISAGDCPRAETYFSPIHDWANRRAQSSRPSLVLRICVTVCGSAAPCPRLGFQNAPHFPGTVTRQRATFYKCHPNPLRFQPAAASPLQSPELQETARRLRLVPPALLSCPWMQLRPFPPSYPPSTTAAWPPRSLHPLPHSAPGSRPPRPTRRRSCSQCARFGKSGIFFPSCLQVLVLLVASPGPSCRDAALPRRDTVCH